MNTDKLFTGQREMTGLGIYHYGARFYSPKLGIFLSPDNVTPDYAVPQTLNLFGYVLNNPLRYTDPTGHWVDEGCGTGPGNPSQGTGCTLPPPPSGGGGGTGGGNGNHPGRGGTNPNPPVGSPGIIPPIGGGDEGIIVVPGPIIIMPPIDLPDPRSCYDLEHDYFGIIDKIRSTVTRIRELENELARTTDPESRQAIQDELDDLETKLLTLVREGDHILAIAKKKGCSTIGWY